MSEKKLNLTNIPGIEEISDRFADSLSGGAPMTAFACDSFAFLGTRPPSKCRR